MIIAKIEDCERYFPLHPELKRLFKYVRSHDMLQRPQGRIELNGEKCYINNGTSQLCDKSARQIETHRNYLDVHMPLDGVEVIGWKATALLGEPSQPYDAAKDCALYDEPADVYFELHPGECCIVFPEDGHAPIIGEGTLRKATAKIRL